MKIVYNCKNEHLGFTVMEFVVAMAMLTAIIVSVAPIMLNPSRNLDNAIKKASDRQTLNIAVEKLSSNLETSFPMRHGFIKCDSGGNNKSLTGGYKTVGRFSDVLNSEDINDYVTHSINSADSSITYYYASYDGIAAKVKDGDTTFTVVEPGRFAVGDIVLLSPVYDTSVSALAKVIKKTVLGNGAAATIEFDTGVTINNTFKCDIDGVKMKTLIEMVATIPFHGTRDKSYKPHTFRIQNIKLEKFSIEEDVNKNSLYLYKWPVGGNVKRTKVVNGVKKLEVWERWLPTNNDETLESGQFFGRLLVEYARIGSKNTQSVESIKLNSAYTVRKGLRSNYDVVTVTPNPTFTEPEGSLTYSLIDDARECDFGSNSWDPVLTDCSKGQEFYQYIKFTVVTESASASITLNVPSGMVCWNADNAVMKSDAGNLGLTFNSRNTIDSTEISLYDRNGFNLFCKVLPKSTAQVLSVTGNISTFVNAYNRDVTKDLNSITVEVPAFEFGYLNEPTCAKYSHQIFTGDLKSLKPTYSGEVQTMDNTGNRESCLWEINDGSVDGIIDACSMSKTTIQKEINSVIADGYKFKEFRSDGRCRYSRGSSNRDRKCFEPREKWFLSEVRLYPRNLIKEDGEIQCIKCDGGAVGTCSTDLE